MLNYTIKWKEKITNPMILNFFLVNQGKNTRYWIPFKYGKNFYIMTFNNCYLVDYDV